jgi:hypothetical protein
MSLAVTIPMLGLGESGRTGRFSLLDGLNIQERDMLDLSGEAPSLLRTAAAVEVRKVCIGAETIAAMTMR